VFYITAKEAELFSALGASDIFVRITMGETLDEHERSTQIDLVFSTIFDLLPDAYY